MEIPGYVVQNTIGHGGMATVYLAIQQSLGRQVVLKVLNGNVTSSSVASQRFLNEGRIVASLTHPNIITIYDVGNVSGIAYISMEYIEGGDLRNRMDRGAFTPAEALGIIEQVASGLALAHRNGVIHRDVKPANILFRTDGTPVLTDFGIAKSLTMDSNLTNTGVFVGSPNYMSPEQADNAGVDGRVDIYSLGVILFELLTGTKPYVSESVMDVIQMHRKAPIPALPESVAHFQELINLMLAKQRTDRFHDVDSLLHYLAQLRRNLKLGALPAPSQAASAAVASTADARTRPIRVKLEAARPSKLRVVLMGLALLLAGVYGGLQMALWDMNKPDSVPRVTVPESFSPAVPATPVAAAGEREPRLEEVVNALAWLGWHSLEDYRLTDPPGDNAYYYFSKLKAIQPAHPEAAAGIAAVADRFAWLAEREIAEGNAELASSYIDVGLQIDPTHEKFPVLQALIKQRDTGLLSRIANLFD